MPTISLCMIVKDEEKFLSSCLESVKELVDEIVIVDTGSTDKTKEIALSFGAKVFDFKWGDDFAAARNESLKHATGDWILVLDADERIAKEDYEKIKELLDRRTARAYRLIQRNYTNNTQRLGFVLKKNYFGDKTYPGWFDSLIVRLFVNNNRIKFRGKVHESVDQSIQELKEEILLSSIVIHHYGEERGIKSNKEKIDFYYKLCKEKVKDNLGDARSHYELGVLSKERGNLELAEEELKKAVEIEAKQNYLLELAVIKQKRNEFDGAITIFLDILRKNKSCPDAYFGLGFCYFKKKELEKSANNFKKAIDFNSNFLDAYINLGGIYEKMGLFKEAAYYLEKAFKMNSGEPRIYYNLGIVHERTGNLEMAARCYQKAIDLNYSGKEELICRLEEIKRVIARKT